MPADERIRHVVVLMLENHSFDHLLGFLGPAFPGQPFEGLRELLVSPWLERGKVDQTVYDHASLLATVKKLFGLPRFLNQRDDTFDHNFTDRGPIMSMMMQPQPQPQRQPQPEPQHSLEPAQVSNEKQLEEQCRVQEREEQSRAHEEERRKRDDQQRQALEEQRRQELVNRYKDELFCALEQTLTDMGYNPPDPSPFLRIRAVQRLRHTEQSDLAHGEAPRR